MSTSDLRTPSISWVSGNSARWSSMPGRMSSIAVSRYAMNWSRSMTPSFTRNRQVRTWHAKNPAMAADMALVSRSLMACSIAHRPARGLAPAVRFPAPTVPIQDAGAVEAPLVEQHPREGQIIGGRREEAAAAPELGRERRLDRLRLQRPVRLALMHAHQSRALLLRGDIIGILHAERAEDVVAEIGVERLAADRFHDAADPVDVDAVFPALARIEHQRHAYRRELARGDRRHAGRLDVADHVGVPDLVAEAGRVGEQVTQRDRPLGRTQLRRAGGVESFQHLRRAERRVDIGHRRLELE